MGCTNHKFLDTHTKTSNGPEINCTVKLSYPGALGLGGARNSDLSVSQNTI